MPAYSKKIKKGDTVQVLSGKDRTKRGKVLQVLPLRGKLVVEGVAMVKKHQKAKSAKQPGEIIDKTLPLDVSKVQLVCPKCNQGTRVGYKSAGADETKKVRFCKKCKQLID